jgi:type IV secretion system protein VirB3
MNERDSLTELPFYTALNKPLLLAGGERELMMMSGLVSLTLIFVALSLQSAIIGIALWLFLSTVLRMMAKKDPMMSKVYVENMKYKKFYPALMSANMMK